MMVKNQQMFRGLFSKTLLTASLTGVVLLGFIGAYGQAGNIDPTFVPGTQAGVNNTIRVQAIAVQDDGKILIGGMFDSIYKSGTHGIARLNPDGSMDATFKSGTGATDLSSGTTYYNAGLVDAIHIQPDGKILVGGYFRSYNGLDCNAIIRLNRDGTLDPTFKPGTGPTLGKGTNITRGHVYAIAQQADGKIIIGGRFESYNGVEINSIARLNIDGSLDLSFDPGSGPSWAIRAIALQADGRILVGGHFETFAGQSYHKLARLNNNGSLDATFKIGAGVQSRLVSPMDPVIYAIGLQKDGKIIIGGIMGRYDGVSRNNIARVNVDGSLDTTFKMGTGANESVEAILVQPDDKILIGGNFDRYNAIQSPSIARINADGTHDNSFDIGVGADDAVTSFAFQADGKILMGGGFRIYKATTIRSIARLHNDISLAPLPPSDLTAVPYNSILLNWLDNSDNEDGFYIENTQDTLAGSWTVIDSVAVDETSYIHSGLNSGEEYFYRVRAFNGLGKSTYSNIAGATEPTGIQEALSFSKTTVYPNPSTGDLKIDFKQPDGKVEIALFAPDGRLIIRKVASKGSSQLDLSDLPKGVYFLHLQHDTGNVTERIIVK